MTFLPECGADKVQRRIFPSSSGCIMFSCMSDLVG